MLVHHGNAVFLSVEWRAKPNPPAVAEHAAARVWFYYASQQLDACALPGAVLTQQRKYFTRPQGERHIPDSRDASKSLGHID
jgi:hypothetical protein